MAESNAPVPRDPGDHRQQQLPHTRDRIGLPPNAVLCSVLHRRLLLVRQVHHQWTMEPPLPHLKFNIRWEIASLSPIQVVYTKKSNCPLSKTSPTLDALLERNEPKNRRLCADWKYPHCGVGRKHWFRRLAVHASIRFERLLRCPSWNSCQRTVAYRPKQPDQDQPSPISGSNAYSRERIHYRQRRRIGRRFHAPRKSTSTGRCHANCPWCQRLSADANGASRSL